MPTSMNVFKEKKFPLQIFELILTYGLLENVEYDSKKTTAENSSMNEKVQRTFFCRLLEIETDHDNMPLMEPTSAAITELK